jgi:alkylation response protein AidB-like acyl-CoA dehydrogenase
VLTQLAADQPLCGAGVAALALDALGDVLEQCRVEHLTRSQHVLLRLGELIAVGECSASLARRAADPASDAKSAMRLRGAELAAMARVFARDAALRIAEEGVRWTGAGPGIGKVHAAQAGLLADMDLVADGLYGRIAAVAAAAGGVLVGGHS